MTLATTLFTDYSWRLCGTVSLTNKKGRSGDVIPLNKLSNSEIQHVTRGWFHEAILEKITSTGHKFYIQAKTWQDKKQVLFLHTNKIGRLNGINVRRHVKGKKQRVKLQSTQAQSDYVLNFNAADNNDCDSAKCSTTIKKEH